MQVSAALSRALELIPPILSAAAAARPTRGISRRQADILACLDGRTPVSLTDLAARLGVTVATMSIGVSRLVRRGWVRRDRDPVDRRVLRLLLSPSGRSAREAGPLDADRLRRVLSRLSAPERGTALQGLEIIATAARRELAERSQRPRY
jgi:DNA-binding MarR family transcriptional regulator